MDYINTPGLLIYKRRGNLNDFGVQTPGTLNHYIFSQMRKMTLLRTGNAKEIALQCFNNAYYICTLIQFEEYPDLCIDKYEKKLLEVEIPFRDDVCAASMGLVCEFLNAYDAKWKLDDNPLIDSIHHWFSHNRWINSFARISFDNIVSTCNSDEFFLPKSEFAPRDIIEAIEEVGKEKPHLLIRGIDYICERLACMDESRRRIYGADLTIAYLNDYLHDTYKDYGYDPKTNSFEPAIPGTFSDEPEFEYEFWKEVKPIKEAIEYIKKHCPTKEEYDSKEDTAALSQVPEAERLQTKIRELESKLTYQKKLQIEANNINAQQVTRIKELEAKVANVKDLEADLDCMKNKIEELELAVQSYKDQGKGLSAPEAAILITAICLEMNQIPANGREGLAPIIKCCWGKSSSTSSEALRRKITEESAEKLACKFEQLTPKIARIIRELPQKLEERNNERLMQINPSVNK